MRSSLLDGGSQLQRSHSKKGVNGRAQQQLAERKHSRLNLPSLGNLDKKERKMLIKETINAFFDSKNAMKNHRN